MNLRLRFVFILTLLVSLILVSSIIVIYLLYSNAREEDYQNRLWAEAYLNYKSYFHINNLDKRTEAQLQKYNPVSLTNPKIVIISDSLKVIFYKPDTAHYQVDTSILKKIKSSGEYYFNNASSESVGLYFSSPASRSYIIVSAYDKYGLIRLGKLKTIMIFVAIGAIIIIGIFSLFYVINATRPLVRLSAQMRHITESNLKERFHVRRESANGNEIVQMTLNFNSMLDRLEHAFEMQKSFVHHASHELRTPLATMLSQTESALKKELGVQQTKEILQSLKEDQQELIELTNNLLMLSQYEKIYYSPDWPMVRLDEILYDSISAAKRMFPVFNINLEFLQLPANESSLSIKGNETLLRSAFRNLIKNAFQYSEDKKLSIIIEATDKKINIHFENNGYTLNTSESDRVFIPFFRGENAQRKKGFGLGLSIVKRIVVLHKGTISYEAINNNLNRYTVSFMQE